MAYPIVYISRNRVSRNREQARREHIMAAVRYFIATPERETEKAIRVSYIYHVDICNPDAEYTTTVWLPKSQIEVYAALTKASDNSVIYKVPAWLVKKNHLDMGCITKKMADEAANKWA